MRYILTDIEGTTTSVAFVYDTLFPYFKQHIASFLNDPQHQAGVADYLQAVRQTVAEESGRVLSFGELAQQLIDWTDTDRKHPALKAIQGSVWRLAYEKNEIKGHVYADVPPALERWKQAGIAIGIYSSGSIKAQQLLFRHSIFGDLTPYFSHYFDTAIGTKRAMESYRTIAAQLELPPADILFLSDVAAELNAAAAAGMQTTQLIRPGTEPDKGHLIAPDFTGIAA